VRARRTALLTHEHLTLLRRLAARDTFYVSDVHYLANVTSLLRHPATRVFEARLRGVLIGFAVTHQYFAQHPLMVVAAFDNHHRASDAVYASLLRYYQARGAAELGLGFAIHQGLHRYKTKWGDVRLGPPCRQVIWQRASSHVVFRDCLHWQWRMLVECWEAY
jgi:hypothetical protein